MGKLTRSLFLAGAIATLNPNTLSAQASLEARISTEQVNESVRDIFLRLRSKIATFEDVAGKLTYIDEVIQLSEMFRQDIRRLASGFGIDIDADLFNFYTSDGNSAQSEIVVDYWGNREYHTRLVFYPNVIALERKQFNNPDAAYFRELRPLQKGKIEQNVVRSYNHTSKEIFPYIVGMPKYDFMTVHNRIRYIKSIRSRFWNKSQRSLFAESQLKWINTRLLQRYGLVQDYNFDDTHGSFEFYTDVFAANGIITLPVDRDWQQETILEIRNRPTAEMIKIDHRTRNGDPVVKDRGVTLLYPVIK